MSDNYCRLIIGIVGSFVLLCITSLNLVDRLIASIIIGYFFGLCNNTTLNLGGVIIHLQNEYNRIKNL